MNYEIILFVYSVEVRRWHKKHKTIDFFEDYENITKFKAEKKKELLHKLLLFGYKIKGEINGMISLSLANDDSQKAMLTNRTLRFSTTGDATQLRLYVAEFLDDKTLSIYHPQTESWLSKEDIMNI